MVLQQTAETFFQQLPDGWTYDRMKDVLTLRSNKIKVQDERADYLELEDIASGTGKLLSRRNTLDVEGSVTLFERGDVLFGKLRPYLKKYCLADSDGKCTGEILAFRPDKITGEYLRYCVASSWFIEKCNTLSYGAKMPRVNWPKQLATFDLPLPPDEEQRRIAGYLDNACRAIDGAIEAKRKQLDTLADLRKSIIHKAVTRGLDDSVAMKPSGVDWLGDIPTHWQCEHLKHVLKTPLMYGTNEPGDTQVPDFPRYVRITDLDDNGQLRDDTFSSLPPERAAGYYLEEDDILLARSGATVGKTFYFGNDHGSACFAGYLIKVQTARHKLLPRFFYLFTKSPEYDTWKYFTFTQATIQNISARRYGYLEVPLPPPDEQEQIIVWAEDKISEVECIERSIAEQICALTDYRKSLIHECVTGKRRIKDADIQKVKEHV